MKKRDLHTFGLGVLLAAIHLFHAAYVQAAAFPGAEGYGADITGGRGGQVIHVTNLNPSGPGSLQEALNTSGPRIIVFDVSGVITADEILIPHGDFTLAGETVPGGGITLNARLNSVYLDYSVTNFIIRHIRIRPTNLSGNQGDSIRIANNSDFILDHISTSWGSDETIDVYQSHDFTIQWSTIEESATYAGHPDGNFHNFGMISGTSGRNVSVHHNLFAHNRQRSPAIANGMSDVVNNVVYNYWRGFNHHNPADTTGFNFIGNYYKDGPDGDNSLAILLDDEDNSSGDYYYMADLCHNGVVAADPWDLVRWWPTSMNPVPGQAENSFNTPAITTHSCLETYDLVLAKAGAWPRDTVTLRTISEVDSGTGSWGREVPADLMEGLTPDTTPTDTDNDGMPDDWERARGLNPSVADDSGDDDGDGYTNIEEYLHYRSDLLINGPPPSTYYACQNAGECNGGTGSGWGAGGDNNECTSKSSPCATIQGGITKMSAGDTLIIGDGLYTGDLNIIDRAIRSANGNSGADGIENTDDDVYTTIKAENFGEVMLDGQNARQMVDLYGGGQGGNISYIQIEGLGTRNSNHSLFRITNADHIKVLRCFAYDGVGTGRDGDSFSVSAGNDILFEECFSYGAGRKHFYVGKFAERVIIRRCVVRHDRHRDYLDQDAFKSYDARNVEFQNCISIDGDQGDYYTGGGETTAKSFSFRDTADGYVSGNVFVRGCLSIGNDDMVGFAGSNDNDVEITDSVHWDSKLGSRMRGAGSKFDHCTFGDVSGTGTWSPLAYLEAGDTITNSLLADAYRGLWNAAGNDYNSLWNIDIPCSNCSLGNNSAILTTDPKSTALLYLTRIEGGSILDGTASDGGDRGATILYKTGRDGTMWGKPGYNELTSDPLWPFPNEDIIKQKMQAYSYDNGNLSGDRGFASSTAEQIGGGNITLTSYIWEYLGNKIPCEIYNTCSCSSGPCDTGDINGDDTVDLTDVIQALQIASGLEPSGITLGGDANGDGRIGVAEAIVALRKTCGLAAK